MNFEEYKQAIMTRINPENDEAREAIDIACLRGFNKSMTIQDLVKYCRCLEEVNPDIAEEYALVRMAKIMEKYN